MFSVQLYISTNAAIHTEMIFFYAAVELLMLNMIANLEKGIYLEYAVAITVVEATAMLINSAYMLIFLLLNTTLAFLRNITHVHSSGTPLSSLRICVTINFEKEMNHIKTAPFDDGKTHHISTDNNDTCISSNSVEPVDIIPQQTDTTYNYEIMEPLPSLNDLDSSEEEIPLDQLRQMLYGRIQDLRSHWEGITVPKSGGISRTPKKLSRH
ncbi:hypothetical protein K7432_007645 [Basidiobolus ranarum]|uniref:Uncharacterized protein n=1 Tax=Basidiobolus ranarum TaxID=34480 RepID=A0ABR2VZT2_9FUNG